ncbi:hypothetical protein [Rhizobium leucaenae]|uniref:hypothetical protein n=1 Tax=Rhizobium leucaenae TaxID=29450 RepID=UPI00160B4EBA|nr:hypothetical protein [Rhizobium leucaenae]
MIELETLVEGGHTFELKPHFRFLADTHRSQFAARVGAGMTDLYMNALGYTWRANAACLSSMLDPHADFIYDGGNVAGHGVVLAEAHGSFATGASNQSVNRQAKRKYARQVKPYIAAMSPFGKVIHGYSVAFGSARGTAGCFLSLSETRITKRRGTRGVPQPAAGVRPDGTQTHIVLASHRSNFLLMGAEEVVDWIDWIRSGDGAAPEPEPIEFTRLQYAGRTYLVSAPRSWRSGISPWWEEDFFGHPGWWRHIPGARRRMTFLSGPRFGWFAIEEKAGAEFLSALTGIIRGGERAIPATLQLPTFQPIGFGLPDSEGLASSRGGGDYRYALFRDGLALLGDPFRGRLRNVVIWSPNEGLSLR